MGERDQKFTANVKPYYAINMSVRNRYSLSATMLYGGLTADEDTGLVIRADGSPIQGLYAAGSTEVGVCSKANCSGLSITDTVFSGRRAALASKRADAEKTCPPDGRHCLNQRSPVPARRQTDVFRISWN